MITDEQLEACRLAANESYKRHKASVRGQIITPEDDWEWHFAREIIALAQQVKPLKFWPCKLAFSADPTPYLRAESVIGPYLIYRSTCQNEKTNYHFSGVHSQSENMLTEAEAIEAANADYRKRVLSCLVWGGV